MPPPIRRLTTKKEPRLAPWPAAALEERIEEIMDRVREAPTTPTTFWVYVQAGIEDGDIGDQAGALEWLTAGLELALRTGDPESALDQLRPLRASCLSALGRPSGEIPGRAAQGETRERR